MPALNISISHRRPLVAQQWTQREGLRWLLNFLNGVVGEGREGDACHWAFNDSVAVQSVDNSPGPAAGLLVLSGGAGAVGATIGGTLVTVAFATSDTNTAGLVAAAIRANTTVNRFVTASNKLAQLTVASVLAGTTVQIFGKTFTAIANGATVRSEGEFSVGASDTACALNLTNAINLYPGLSMRCRAVSVAGVVFIGLWDDRAPLAWERIQYPRTSAGVIATTITIQAAIPVAGTRVMVFANVSGQVGNFVTVAASGTGMTYATNGAAGQLGSGSGGAAPAQTFDVLL